MDISRRTYRPEPKLGKAGPCITYALLTVQDRSEALQFATPGGKPTPKAKNGKRVRPAMDAPPSGEMDQNLFVAATCALVLRDMSGVEADGQTVTWCTDLPLSERVAALDSWPIRWLRGLFQRSTEEAELDPEEERGDCV